MRPVIGITSYAQEASFGSWTLPTAFVPLSYVRSVERAGGRPLVVPPAEGAEAETLDALDGLVLSGGADVDPGHYGSEAHPETVGTQPERDRAELGLLAAALARHLPVLAICRGVQLLNVLHGGDLHQHLPELVGSERHREVPGTFSEHRVTIDPESRLGRALGAEVPVKSHHHQGLGNVGRGLAVVARAEDGTVEALEDPERPFALGVLWHPEEDDDARLFGALVAEAAAYRAGAGPPDGAAVSGSTRPRSV